MAAELWEGLQGLGGKNAPTDRLADVLVAQNGQKPAWMAKFFLKSEKDRQDMDKKGCPQNESGVPGVVRRLTNYAVASRSHLRALGW